jgi:hypothetical protein
VPAQVHAELDRELPILANAFLLIFSELRRRGVSGEGGSGGEQTQNEREKTNGHGAFLFICGGASSHIAVQIESAKWKRANCGTAMPEEVTEFVTSLVYTQ